MALNFEQSLELHRQGRSEPGGFTEGAECVYDRLTGSYGLDPEEAHWLAIKRMRVELNAPPSDQIISLIEGALGGGEKLLPSDKTLMRAYHQAIAGRAKSPIVRAGAEKGSG